MKQLGASAWERMGLIVGTHGPANHAVRTAKATEETAKNTARIAQALLPRSGAMFTNPAYPNA
jgi:hypothetical protein